MKNLNVPVACGIIVLLAFSAFSQPPQAQPGYWANALTDKNCASLPLVRDDGGGLAKIGKTQIFGDYCQMTVRNQGPAATCFAYAIVGAMEYGWYKLKFAQIQLSPVFIIGRYYSNNSSAGYDIRKTPTFNLSQMLQNISTGGVAFQDCQPSLPTQPTFLSDPWIVPNNENSSFCKSRVSFPNGVVMLQTTSDIKTQIDNNGYAVLALHPTHEFSVFYQTDFGSPYVEMNGHTRLTDEVNALAVHWVVAVDYATD
jgi:hypothetical protein